MHGRSLLPFDRSPVHEIHLTKLRFVKDIDLALQRALTTPRANKLFP